MRTTLSNAGRRSYPGCRGHFRTFIATHNEHLTQRGDPRTHCGLTHSIAGTSADRLTTFKSHSVVIPNPSRSVPSTRRIESNAALPSCPLPVISSCRAAPDTVLGVVGSWSPLGLKRLDRPVGAACSRLQGVPETAQVFKAEPDSDNLLLVSTSSGKANAAGLYRRHSASSDRISRNRRRVTIRVSSHEAEESLTLPVTR